jgi:hypothetical protein
MLHLSDLLAAIPLPAAEPDESEPAAALRRAEPRAAAKHATPAAQRGDMALVHDLGADLPAGHMHVWGGPTGAGKTSFLLTLLRGAAAQGRRVVYATYDLPAETLALRMLAMAAGVDVGRLPDPGGPESAGGLSAGALERTCRARAALSGLPFSFLQARGFSTHSLADRLVRMPFRAEVLAVDYLQGVIREPGTDLGVALRSLSDMAQHLHVAIVCAVRAAEEGTGEGARALTTTALGAADDVPDRVGWIAPARCPGGHRAEVIRNRYGEGRSVPLHFDEASTGFHPA